MSEDTTLQQLTLFAEDSPAKTCPLPEIGKAWLESGQGFGLNSIELLRSLGQDGWLSRMSLAFYPAARDGTLPSSFEGWSNAGMASPGGFLTLSTSEWPSDAAVCSLWQVLEVDVHPRYFLSARAARGILRRAEKRGRDLPPILQQALETLATAAGDGRETPSRD